MASFTVLAEEKKILRRKEKEQQRKAKLEEKLKQGALAGNVGKWADASDEDEDDKLFQPVSDSESDSHDDEKEDSVVARPASSATEVAARAEVAKDSSNGKIEASASKSKKDQKKVKGAKDEEDIDNVLAEFGIEVDQLGGATSSKRKKKKDKEVVSGEGLEEKPQVDVQEAAKPKEAASETSAAADQKDRSEEDDVLDEGARQAALEALKKKTGSKNKKSVSDASKYAAAEAKQRSANHKPKRDKSMYDR